MSKVLSGYVLIFFGIAICSIQSCAQNGNTYSRVAVTNGETAVNAEFQAVVKLKRYDGEVVDPIICTASFLDETHILTAAHCLGTTDDPVLDVEWKINGSDSSVVKPASIVAVHPLFKKGGRAIQPNDLAILAVDVARELVPSPIMLSNDAVTVGSDVTLVGYGNNIQSLENGNITGTGLGIKRIGKNKVYASTRSGLIIVSGNPGRCATVENSSATADGDSGGPLIISDQIIGVTLGGGIIPAQSENSCQKAISYFANLTLKDNAEFVKINIGRSSQ